MFPELVDNADDELKAVNGEAKEAVKNMMMAVEEPQEEDDGMQGNEEEAEKEVE
jgi:hypothetical protein